MSSHSLAATLGELWPVLLAFGLGGLARAAWLRRRAAAVRGWPTVEGRVIQAHVHKGRTGTNIGHADGPYLTVYRARIVYAYAVAGRRYEASRLQIGVARRLRRRAQAEALVASYPVGRTVTVHYDPARPEEATLTVEVTPTLGESLRWSLGALALAACVAIVAARVS